MCFLCDRAAYGSFEACSLRALDSVFPETLARPMMEWQERSDNYARETGLPRVMFISGKDGPLLDHVAGVEPVEEDAVDVGALIRLLDGRAE